MGYDVHVHRREDFWEEEDGVDIEEEDLDEVAGQRSDLVRRETFEARNVMDEVITIQGPFWIWTGHSRGVEVPLSHRLGTVVVKGPDDETLAFLIELAAALDARVQGDEGEFYGE